jgi:calcineurin-like phosphoesterase family protein
MVNDMDAGLIENWNKLVKPGDTVYHLGDFCLTVRVDLIDHWLGQLNGEIRLLRGNHDNWVKRYDRLVNKDKIKWIRDYAERTFVVDGVKYKFILCHYPMLFWKNSHHGSIMLHGHSHGSANHHNTDVRRMDVGVDTNGCCPVLLENIVTMMQDRGVNHHHGE